ncbi:cellulose synthase D5, partial [Olea europaea subsp. europaea]
FTQQRTATCNSKYTSFDPCYLLSDGNDFVLTFEALVEAATFAKLWVPLCKKHKIEADGFIFKPPKNRYPHFNHKGEGDVVGFQATGNEDSAKFALESFCPICLLKTKEKWSNYGYDPVEGVTRLK